MGWGGVVVVRVGDSVVAGGLHEPLATSRRRYLVKKTHETDAQGAQYSGAPAGETERLGQEATAGDLASGDRERVAGDPTAIGRAA